MMARRQDKNTEGGGGKCTAVGGAVWHTVGTITTSGDMSRDNRQASSVVVKHCKALYTCTAVACGCSLRAACVAADMERRFVERNVLGAGRDEGLRLREIAKYKKQYLSSGQYGRYRSRHKLCVLNIQKKNKKMKLLKSCSSRTLKKD